MLTEYLSRSNRTYRVAQLFFTMYGKIRPVRHTESFEDEPRLPNQIVCRQRVAAPPASCFIESPTIHRFSVSVQVCLPSSRKF